MAALIPCPRRIIVDGKLAAYKGMLITEEQAEAFGLSSGEKSKPNNVCEEKSSAPDPSVADTASTLGSPSTQKPAADTSSATSSTSAQKSADAAIASKVAAIKQGAVAKRGAQDPTDDANAGGDE